MTPVNTAVRKWGNSVAIRIPKKLADKLNLEDGRSVDIVEDGKGGLRVTRSPQVDESLESMVSRITPENRHELTDWGPPVGNEVW